MTSRRQNDGSAGRATPSRRFREVNDERRTCYEDPAGTWILRIPALPNPCDRERRRAQERRSAGGVPVHGAGSGVRHQRGDGGPLRLHRPGLPAFREGLDGPRGDAAQGGGRLPRGGLRGADEPADRSGAVRVPSGGGRAFRDPPGDLLHLPAAAPGTLREAPQGSELRPGRKRRGAGTDLRQKPGGLRGQARRVRERPDREQADSTRTNGTGSGDDGRGDRPGLGTAPGPEHHRERPMASGARAVARSDLPGHPAGQGHARRQPARLRQPIRASRVRDGVPPGQLSRDPSRPGAAALRAALEQPFHLHGPQRRERDSVAAEEALDAEDQGVRRSGLQRDQRAGEPGRRLDGERHRRGGAAPGFRYRSVRAPHLRDPRARPGLGDGARSRP